MPTFCRHNRFIERCPICSKTLSGAEPARKARPPRTSGASARTRRAGGTTRREHGVRVRHETRAADDGYRSELVPGLHASADAERLAGELGFSASRLLALAADPPGLYGELRERAAGGDVEGSTWGCFLLAYLSPVEEGDPFAGVRTALAAIPPPPPARAGADLGADRGDGGGERPDAWPGALDLDAIPLGPRSSHVHGRGATTLRAYAQWVARGGGGSSVRAASPDDVGAGGQRAAFTGDPSWSPQRRFERVYERLALPGLTRAARYEVLVTLGRLGIYPLVAERLYLAPARGAGEEDPATAAAKRVFGIADPQLLERRAGALAAAAGVPIEALDLALANWGAPARATLGVPAQACEPGAVERARAALGV